MLVLNIKYDIKATHLEKITITFDQKNTKKHNKKLEYNRRRNLDSWLQTKVGSKLESSTIF